MTSRAEAGSFGGRDLPDGHMPLADIIASNNAILQDIIKSQPDYDPTAWEIGLTKGELKQLSKVVGLPAFYGTRKISGVTVYLEQRKSGTGATGYSYYGGSWQQSVVLCEGEVADIIGVWIDDTYYLLTEGEVYDRTYIYDTHATWNISIKNFNGADDQVANASDVDALSFTIGNLNQDSPNTSWSSAHTLSGVAHADFRFQLRNNESSTTLPKLQFLVSGLISGSTNPALILKDYLTNTRYGCSVPLSEIDTSSFTTAENVCNQTNEGIKRHECNVILDSQKSLIDNIKIILTSCNGQLHWIDGKYKMHIDDVYTGSNVFDFEEKHIIGGIRIIGESKSRRANQVKAKFMNPDTWKSDEVSWPDSADDDYSTFLTEDNDIPLKKEISLQTVTNWHQARFIAQQACLLSRNSLGFNFTATSEALNVVVGDIISVTHSTPAWSAKKFIVRSVGINMDGTVSLSGVEYQAATYTWNQAEAPAVTPDTDLPDPTIITAPLDLSIEETSYSSITSGGKRIRVTLSWSDNTEAFTTGYDFQYQDVTSSLADPWIQAGTSISSSGLMNDFEKGTFDFRVRAINAVGAKSDWTYLNNQLIEGVTTPPETVTGLVVNNHGSNAVVTFDEPADATDISHIAIGVLQTGSTEWDDAEIIATAGVGTTTVVVPVIEGNYVAKWVGSGGLESVDYMDSGSVTVYGSELVATFAEQEEWAGTLDGLYETVDDGDDVLKFLGGDLWDDFTGLMDTWLEIDSQGGNVESASYIGVKRDLGAVLPARIYTNKLFTSTITDGSNFMDYWTLVDDRDSWDEVAKLDGLITQIRTTQDDPAAVDATWTAYKPFLVSDVVARGLQMKVNFEQFSSNEQFTLRELELLVDMVVRFESDKAKTATSITYDDPFYNIPDLVVTPINMATGDYMTISSEAKTGFGINFYNSSAVAQTRTYNYIARGK